MVAILDVDGGHFEFYDNKFDVGNILCNLVLIRNTDFELEAKTQILISGSTTICFTVPIFVQIGLSDWVH